ncbi:hypothetical protein [Xanthobacter aminoxidans]|uniref:hypothetical protein n=1 Tax=Xanthobacter aminoxidans TaxID=186280 RepID=UPI002022C5A4|nr:hypothetical protein [Xanthobacter aminoxidans]MCL8382471.1 hypothetical protein [Xanthobacter aminoxidans]
MNNRENIPGPAPTGTHVTPLPSLPVPFEHQPELRAFLVLNEVPPGHMTFEVPDDTFAPHLQKGEFAVVDLSDHEPWDRELYVISFTSPRTRVGLAWRIVQMRARSMFLQRGRGWTTRPEPGSVPATCWTACFWMPPDDPAERERLRRAGMVGTSDGPYTTEHAAECLVGRIVGVFVPAVREARAGGLRHA